jgi:CHASE3 domain sensor protein
LRLAGGFAMAVGATTVLGWITNTQRLVQWLPGGSHMVMNTALCVLLCGAGVLGLANEWRRVAAGCGVMTAALAGTVLMQFLLGRKLGVDEFFWKHQWGEAVLTPAGQMAPNATVAFVLLGFGLVMLALRRTGRWLLPALGGVVAAFALVPLLSFLTARLAGSAISYRGMALPTVAALLVLAAALLRRAQVENARESAAQSLMAAAFGMLVSIGVAAAQSNADVIGANNAVVRIHEVRGEIDRFIEEIARMESSSRAFALTGEDYFRLRAEERRAEVRAQIETVQRLVAGHASQAARAARLRELAEEKFTQNDELTRARQQGGAAAAARYLSAMLTQPSRPASSLVNLADEARAEENRLLAVRERDRRAVEFNARAVQALGSLMALGLLSAAAVSARRAAAAGQIVDRELRVSRERLRRIFGAVADGIVLQNARGEVEECNAAAERILARTHA